MNIQKLSGAKTLFFQIKNVGRNYLPLVEDLRERYIKYMDIVPCTSVPGSAADVIDPSVTATTISMSDKGNIYFIQDLPVQQLDPIYKAGVRQPIMSKLSVQNTYLNVTDSGEIGKYYVMVFWYDLPEYSARNTTDRTSIDTVEIPVKSVADRQFLPDNRSMAGKRFRNFYLPALAGQTPTFTPTVDADQLGNIYISFCKGNYTVLDHVPVQLFQFYQQYMELTFANIIFDFTYSYLDFGGKTDKKIVGTSLMLSMKYENR